ncbi:MAG: hypothetical protein AAF193_10790 [Bacteroidota bacterium]
MKIRIRGNSVRLRLKMDEVDQLINGHAVKEKTWFASNVFHYHLEPHTTDGADFKDNCLHIYCNQSTLNTFGEPDKVSIQFTAGETVILIEKDFKCLIERSPEEDENAYPNPLAAEQ